MCDWYISWKDQEICHSESDDFTIHRACGFINAFENSRRLVLSRQIEPNDYLTLLKEALESGVAPEGVYDYIEKELEK